MEKSSQTGKAPKWLDFTLSCINKKEDEQESKKQIANKSTWYITGKTKRKNNNQKKKNMRTKEFEVPSDFITEFAEALAEYELTNEINGVNEEGDILIEVSYEKQERANVFTLSELLDDYYENEEESEE